MEAPATVWNCTETNTAATTSSTQQTPQTQTTPISIMRLALTQESPISSSRASSLKCPQHPREQVLHLPQAFITARRQGHRVHRSQHTTTVRRLVPPRPFPPTPLPLLPSLTLARTLARLSPSKTVQAQTAVTPSNSRYQAAPPPLHSSPFPLLLPLPPRPLPLWISPLFPRLCLLLLSLRPPRWWR